MFIDPIGDPNPDPTPKAIVAVISTAMDADYDELISHVQAIPNPPTGPQNFIRRARGPKAHEPATFFTVGFVLFKLKSISRHMSHNVQKSRGPVGFGVCLTHIQYTQLQGQTFSHADASQRCQGRR